MFYADRRALYPRRPDMHAFFGPGGRLAASLPGFEPRMEQAALAQEVADALERGQHLLAEAGTGIGKSLAYLIPALESGQRVVVVTATKALQEQLLTKDVPAASAALGREVDVAVLKGRQNYLCRKSLNGLALPLFRTAEDAAEYERLQDWMETTETGDRAELSFEPRPTLWAEVAVGPDRCAGRRCPFLATCFSEQARARAQEAELVIANHALYFADLALRAKTGDGAGVLPDHDAVVFDEAHRLEESAAAWFGGRVSLGSLRQLLRDVERACREAARAVPARALDAIDRRGEELLAGLDPGRGRRRLGAADVEAAAGPATALATALGQLAEALRGGSEDLDQLARRSLATVDDLGACLAVEDEDSVSWAEQGALAWAPVDVSETLRELLWDREAVSVLVSATLEPSFLRGRLGLDDAREVSLPSPYDYREQALLYVPRAFPEPRSPAYDERLADEVLALCRLSEGRALVLTTSYTGSTRWPSGWRRGSPTRCSCRAKRRASGCSHASATRWTRSSSRRRPSGRGWTSRASRSRCSSSTSCRSRPRTTRSSRRGASGSPREEGTGSRSTRCRPRCSSSARGSVA